MRRIALQPKAAHIHHHYLRSVDTYFVLVFVQERKEDGSSPVNRGTPWWNPRFVCLAISTGLGGGGQMKAGGNLSFVASKGFSRNSCCRSNLLLLLGERRQWCRCNLCPVSARS